MGERKEYFRPLERIRKDFPGEITLKIKITDE